MDFVAMLYSVWLCVLFSKTRKSQAVVWPYFKFFICAMILIQYIVMVGLPPFLCIGIINNSTYCVRLLNKLFVLDYPWDSIILKHLAEWAWLPDKTLSQQSDKLILDYLLLMLACRQVCYLLYL